MRILAIETSGRQCSAAALWGVPEDAELLHQIAITGEQRTAQALQPSLHELLTHVGWRPPSVEFVAVAVGPGSFTGLRIGVTTAKTFAYAVGAKVVGVNTLAVLAAQSPQSPAPLWTVLNAQRQELFVARFVDTERDNQWTDCDTTIVACDAWLTQLKPGDRVTGPPLSSLKALLPPGVAAVPQEFWQPMAAAVGRVGWHAYQRGQRDDVWKLAPRYYRPSAPEYKLQ
jgi:tRNA threonylcarbamoyladenosine biosynthesis protein TsaB